MPVLWQIYIVKLWTNFLRFRAICSKIWPNNNRLVSLALELAPLLMDPPMQFVTVHYGDMSQNRNRSIGAGNWVATPTVDVLKKF